MHLLGTDTYLGSQSELAAVGEGGRYVHIDARCIRLLLEQTGFLCILCYYALTVV